VSGFPWSGHIIVGTVPVINASEKVSGQEEVAGRWLIVSILTNSIPSGAVNSISSMLRGG
jgi:hypothetical protein